MQQSMVQHCWKNSCDEVSQILRNVTETSRCGITVVSGHPSGRFRSSFLPTVLFYNAFENMANKLLRFKKSVINGEAKQGRRSIRTKTSGFPVVIHVFTTFT
jgi:hypothetical protein